MQITKELLQSDVKGLEAQLEQLKTQVAQTTGALAAIKAMVEYMDKPEPEPVGPALQNKEEEVSGLVVVDGNGKYNEVEGA